MVPSSLEGRGGVFLLGQRFLQFPQLSAYRGVEEFGLGADGDTAEDGGVEVLVDDEVLGSLPQDGVSRGEEGRQLLGQGGEGGVTEGLCSGDAGALDTCGRVGQSLEVAEDGGELPRLAPTTQERDEPRRHLCLRRIRTLVGEFDQRVGIL